MSSVALTVQNRGVKHQSFIHVSFAVVYPYYNAYYDLHFNISPFIKYVDFVLDKMIVFFKPNSTMITSLKYMSHITNKKFILAGDSRSTMQNAGLQVNG